MLSLSLVAIACLPCRTATQLAITPTRTVPVSTRAAGDLVSALTWGIVPDSEGRFTLVITEEQLTSYVALNMQESIVDPQILLSDGSIHINGTLVSPIGAPVSALARLQTGETGAHLVVESVSVGGFPMPETFVEAFAQQVDDLIGAAERIDEVEIDSIEIGEGKMIIQGTVAS